MSRGQNACDQLWIAKLVGTREDVVDETYRGLRVRCRTAHLAPEDPSNGPAAGNLASSLRKEATRRGDPPTRRRPRTRGGSRSREHRSTDPARRRRRVGGRKVDLRLVRCRLLQDPASWVRHRLTRRTPSASSPDPGASRGAYATCLDLLGNLVARRLRTFMAADGQRGMTRASLIAWRRSQT